MAAKRGLGRGLSALISEGSTGGQAAAGNDVQTGAVEVAVDAIVPNPRQPRRHFAPAALAELAASIQVHGVLQPLLLRRSGHQFELVAGERRWRAARQAGLTMVPAIIKEVSDSDALELTLIENLQREDLNPVEEAEGYQSLIEHFALSHDDIAQRVGKARATVSNALRLLALPPEIKQMLTDGRLSAGHAKALLGAVIEREQIMLARQAVAEGWSVRVLEKAVERLSRAPRKPRAARDDMPADFLKDLTDNLQRHFGTQVRLIPSRTLANGKKAKGSLEIVFYSNDDLTRILELLGLAEQD